MLQNDRPKYRKTFIDYTQHGNDNRRRTIGDHRNGTSKPNTFENIAGVVDDERGACG